MIPLHTHTHTHTLFLSVSLIHYYSVSVYRETAMIKGCQKRLRNFHFRHEILLLLFINHFRTERNTNPHILFIVYLDFDFGSFKV